MARPTRQGVDYFPLDIHLDDKFKFIQIKYGLEGFAVVIKLMQKIYSYGYWYQWGEDESLIFAHENVIEMDKLDMIIEETIKRGIFHEGIFKSYQVLTSSGIQKRYKEIVKRRKDVEIVTEYLLLDNNFGVSTIIEPTECIHDDDIEPTECIHDDDISTQSKVDKSKLDKSILDDTKKIKPPTKIKYGEFNKVSLLEEEYKKLIENIGQALTNDLIERLDSYKASTGKVYKSDYATILNWHRKEIKESGQLRNDVTEFKRNDDVEDIATRAGVTSL